MNHALFLLTLATTVSAFYSGSTKGSARKRKRSGS